MVWGVAVMNSGYVQYKDFGQLDFWSEQIYSQMPPDPFLDAVAKYIDFSFADAICEPYYSHLGQNAYAPSLMLRIRFIHAYNNLSDRQLEYGLRYNLAYKKFVGFPANYYTFDHSSREDFDSRIPVEVHKAVFYHILAQIIDHGLIGPRENWIVDATHSLSRATHHTVPSLIRQGITQLLYALKRAARSWTETLGRQLGLSAMIDERLHYKAAEEKKLQNFSRLVVTAYGILARVEQLLAQEVLTEKYTELVTEKAAILRKILSENVDTPKNDSGSSGDEVSYVQKPKEEKPKNSLASAVDPDARHSAKSDKKHYMGHKVQNVISAESQFIVNIEGISATENDGESFLDVVDEAKKQTDLSPQKILVDGQYTTMANLKGAQQREFQLVGNIKEPANPKGGYPASAFHYDVEHKTLTCPAKVTTIDTYRNETAKTTVYRFPAEVCLECTCKKKCTISEKGRTISISDSHHLVLEAKKYLRTEEGKADMKKRPRVERPNGVVKNRFGLDTTNSWGAKKYKIQGYWAGIAYNVSRAVKLLFQKKQSTAVVLQ